MKPVPPRVGRLTGFRALFSQRPAQHGEMRRKPYKELRRHISFSGCRSGFVSFQTVFHRLRNVASFPQCETWPMSRPGQNCRFDHPVNPNLNQQIFGAPIGMSKRCHVWTAPVWQEEFRSQAQPLGAVHMTAGHDALRESSGLGQKHPFDDAMAQVGCTGRGSTGSALRAVRPPNLHITPVALRDLA